MKAQHARQCVKKAGDLTDLMDGADWDSNETDDVILSLAERDQDHAREVLRRLWIRIDREIS